MAKCIGCGAENQAGEKYCSECGMKLPVEAKEQSEKHSATNDKSVAAMGTEQFEAYRAEFEKVAVDGSLNLLARRKLKSVQKLLNLSDEHVKSFEERILAERMRRQEEIVARKAEEARIRQEELDKKRREEEARKAEEERIRQEELEKKRREKAARKAEKERARQAELDRERQENVESHKQKEDNGDVEAAEGEAESSDKKSGGDVSTVIIAILAIVLVAFLVWGGWWLICLLFRHWIITGLVVIGLIVVGAAASK